MKFFNRSFLTIAATVVSMVVLTTCGVPTSAHAASEASVTERASEVAGFVETAEQQSPRVVIDARLRHDLMVGAAAEAAALPAGTELDPKTTEVLAVGTGYVVRTSLQGDGVASMSSRSVVFDSPTKVAGALDYVFRADGNGGGRLDVFQDGERNWSDSISGAEADRVASHEQVGTHGAGDFWERLNSCLTNQGVASWMLALIAGACAAVCFFTAGLGCAACIGAVIGFPSGVIGACVAYANQ